MKRPQTEFEPNQTNTNGFNQFRFQFQKFWLKLNSLVSSLGKNGLNRTKPNFPNTTGDVLKKPRLIYSAPRLSSHPSYLPLVPGFQLCCHVFLQPLLLPPAYTHLGISPHQPKRRPLIGGELPA